MGMRHNYTSDTWEQRQENLRKAAEQRLAGQNEKRKMLANKIAMMVIDQISNEIVRPGPVSEERECYDMANELREHKPEVQDLIAQILTSEHVFDD